MSSSAAERRKQELYRRSIVDATMQETQSLKREYAEYARLMYDLLTIAFQTDLTRVATFMLAREGGVRPYPEIGCPKRITRSRITAAIQR